MFATGAAVPSRLDPLAWHIHEMLFGFVMTEAMIACPTAAHGAGAAQAGGGLVGLGVPSA